MKKKKKKEQKKKKHVPFQPLNEREGDSFTMDVDAKGAVKYRGKKRSNT
jgi:desulfoferrodoxin (superoxide reductase-like protein)